MFSDQANLRYFGEHEMEILPEGLTSAHRHGVDVAYWPGLIRVQETEMHIYLCAISAQIVPKKDIIEGDFEPFIQAVKDRDRVSAGCIADLPAVAFAATWRNRTKQRLPATSRLE